MPRALDALATSGQGKAGEERHAARLREASAVPARVVLALLAEDAMVGPDAAVCLSMADETIDYAVIKLREFLATGDFASAEFAALMREGRKYDTQVYLLRLDAQIAARAAV